MKVTLNKPLYHDPNQPSERSKFFTGAFEVLLRVAVLFMFLGGLALMTEGFDQPRFWEKFRSDNALGSSANSLLLVNKRLAAVQGILWVLAGLLVCAIICIRRLRRAPQSRNET